MSEVATLGRWASCQSTVVPGWPTSVAWRSELSPHTLCWRPSLRSSPGCTGGGGGLAVISPGLYQQGTNQGNRKSLFELHTNMFPEAGNKLCELMKQENSPGISPPPLQFSQLGRGCSHPSTLFVDSGSTRLQQQQKKTLSGGLILFS